MGHMGRPGLSASQKADLWKRWKQGQSLSEIGRALGYHAWTRRRPSKRTQENARLEVRSRLPMSAHVGPTGQNGYVMS